MADFSASEKDLETLFGKYPQVGVFKGKRRPYDALWLPSGWESAAYPRGTNESDNARAILEWLSFQIERLLGQARQSREFLERYPEEVEACGYDETPVVADTYSLVAWLQERNGWPNAPTEPGRKYTRLPEDLEAAVEELRRVQAWVVTWFRTADRQKGGSEGHEAAAEGDRGGRQRSARGKGKRGRKRKRGLYRTGYDREAEAKLYDDWKAAKKSGTRRIADFARDKGLDESKVREAIERVRSRRRRMP